MLIKIVAGLPFPAAYHMIVHSVLAFCSVQFYNYTPPGIQCSSLQYIKCSLQCTDMDGRCPLLSNSAQTISHFTTLEWSLQQSSAVFLCTALRCFIALQCTEVLSPPRVPVYEFEMVTKSQFHPRWATVMVLSGDCSNLKMQQKVYF